MLNRRPELATNAIRDPGVPPPGNDRATPFHFDRRPRSMQLRHRRHRSTLQHQRQHSHKDRGLCTTNPVLPGPIWVSLLSPCVSHTEKSSGPSSGGAACPHLPRAGKLLGKILSPHPLLRVWVANTLLRACFSGMHKAPSGTGATPYHTIPYLSKFCSLM